jgi:hypothetical protein
VLAYGTSDFPQAVESKQLDENHLGLEHLCTLMDPSKVLSKEADQASQTLLSESSKQGLLEKCFVDMELIHNQPMAKEEEDNDFTMEYMQNKGSSLFFGSLHPLAQGNFSVLGVSSL